jgi:hypothetical protein
VAAGDSTTRVISSRSPADPRLPRLVGEHEDRGAERGRVRPADLTLVEYAAAHHVGAGAGELLLGDLVVAVDLAGGLLLPFPLPRGAHARLVDAG